MASLFSTVASRFSSFALLKVSVSNPELSGLYKDHVKKHNDSILSDLYPNSGFDLLVPNRVSVLPGFNTQMLSMDVKCEMLYNGKESCGYYMFPRSSISKTPLMLANHTGIIDSGYRGNLIGAFRNLDSVDFTVEKNTRLLQVCHPSLCPIYVVLVEDEKELSTTARGEGGFGSTGK